mmetsp:Transcript_21987/g.32768  ORF Transcript_21987/g.32768 Transcript_21987/m.32768 type:complete len:316 (-) Transcript_21987:110-1057(-)
MSGEMIILPRHHPILKTTLEHQLSLAKEVKEQDPKLDSKEKKKLGTVSMTFYDFENSHYKVEIQPKKSSILTVSLKMPCFSSIENEGVTDVLEKDYKDLVVDTAKGYDVSLGFDVMDLPIDEKKLMNLVVSLKENLVTAPLLKYFNALLSGSPLSDRFSFDLRPDTTMFIVPSRDRVTVTLRISFENEVDREVAEIFLKDYKDVQRRKVGVAPPALFSVEPPIELKGEEKGTVGFISFAVQKTHLRKPVVCAAALVNFRTFLHYHLKCSKAFFHSRMRKKVREFLKVLNRAKTDFEGETKKKAKKTASGRHFVKR